MQKAQWKLQDGKSLFIFCSFVILFLCGRISSAMKMSKRGVCVFWKFISSSSVRFIYCDLLLMLSGFNFFVLGLRYNVYNSDKLFEFIVLYAEYNRSLAAIARNVPCGFIRHPSKVLIWKLVNRLKLAGSLDKRGG